MGDSTHSITLIVGVAPLPSEREMDSSYNVKEAVSNVVIATAIFPFSFQHTLCAPQARPTLRAFDYSSHNVRQIKNRKLPRLGEETGLKCQGEQRSPRRKFKVP